MATSEQMSILVVDDNPATLYSTSRVLRSAGLNVVEASSGQDALAQARQGASLVVLDINLPDIDGFQVCRALRAAPETARIPIIYLSATFVDDFNKVEGVNAGADGYLTHPVEPPVLVATVNAFLRLRRAEVAVQESEAKFKAVFENALHGIALLSQDLIFLDANSALCRILGRDRESIIGRHLSAFSPKERQVVSQEMTAALAASKAWRGLFPLLNAEGIHVELEWSISAHSDPNVNLAIVNDLTERRASEAERERLLVSERVARAEAEQANRLKDDFLATLSHELRTPLSAIMGFSRVLQMHPVTQTADVLDSINAIERNARVQAQLIADLLDLSRIASGKFQLERQWLAPADVLQSALTSTAAAADAKQVTIRVEIDAQVQEIWWDLSRFQQVVWNLIDNAVKFSNDGGEVEVRLTQSHTSVDLEVRDHGRGITADFLPFVFERFRQEESGSRREYRGLGLGLAVVHQIVLAHGATITASSQGKDKGATFIVRLPLLTPVSAAGTPSQVHEDATADLRGIRILVVDDNADARVLTRRLLDEVAAEVLLVADVKSALANLNSFNPDLLLSDLSMPGEDGYDLIRSIRQQGWSHERLPAIALTAFAREADRDRALQAGYQAHIAKPLDRANLMAEIRSLIGQR